MFMIQRAKSADLAGTTNGTGHEVECEENEYEQRADLYRETGNHDVVAELWVLMPVCFDRRNAATCGLQDKWEDVASNEYDWIELCADAWIVAAKGNNDTREAEINASSKEGRCDSEAADLNEEGSLVDVSSGVQL
jgi:hypothetical protein